jgi:glyoxylase I family protein
MKYTPHHTAISIQDLDKTIKFYSVFGLSEVHRYSDEDKTGVKLKLDDYILEIFAYKKNVNEKPVDTNIGNDLDRMGVKHFGFSVEDVDEALKELRFQGLADETTKILTKGTARFFFIKDPNGLWVEVIRDDRY